MTVVGLIGAIITIIETSKKLYKASHDAKGLHEAFRGVAENMRLVVDILRDCQIAQQRVDNAYKTTSNATEKSEIEKSSEAVKVIMQGCKERAEALGEIFEKVLPGDNADWLERYKKAARSLKPGREKKVEDLMTGILEQLQLLHASRFFKSELEERAVDIKAAIDKLSELGPSLPDDDGRFVHTGSGPLNAYTGSGNNIYNQSGANSRQYTGHIMHFGKDD
jgi:hypothetical protein